MSQRYRILSLGVWVGLVATLCAGPVYADLDIYTAVLSGDNEVPPVVTAATGVATLTIDTENGDLGAVPLQVAFSGLSSGQTGAHIHQAPAGLNGGVVVGLSLGSPLDTTVALDASAYDALVAEGLYLNIHTATFPAGEIRGQFVLSENVPTTGAAWGAVKALFR